MRCAAVPPSAEAVRRPRRRDLPAGALLLSQRAAHAGPGVPMHLELVTVTDTSAVITWFTGDPTAPDEYVVGGPGANEPE